MGADADRRGCTVIIVTQDSDSHILFVCFASCPSPGIASLDFEDVSDSEIVKLSTILGALTQLCSGNSKSSPVGS